MNHTQSTMKHPDQTSGAGESNIWVRGFTPDGFQISLTLDATATQQTVNTLLAKLDFVRAAGITPSLPGLDPGQEKQIIAAVMRRTGSDGTPIIDFYPEWNANGSYGAYKYGHMYLDTPDEIAAFEQQSGLKLADVPAHDGQAPHKRTFGKPHPKEVAVKRPFELVRTEIGTADDGKPKYRYSFFSPAGQPSQSTPQPEPDTPPALPADSKPDNVTEFPQTKAAYTAADMTRDDGSLDFAAYQDAVKYHDLKLTDVLNRVRLLERANVGLNDISIERAVEILNKLIAEKKA